MSHASKAKAKGVSASSFFDLKAELSKKEAEFAKSKAAGKSLAIVGGVKRPEKKPTVWARQNKGVNSRASRDVELEAISKPTLESARAALERKAKIYDKLKKGKTGGLTDKQYDALLVDFDAMPNASYESDSEDEDESLTVPRPPNDEHDPIIEYEDEFGRVRTARRSEVPRNLVPALEEVDPDEDIIIRNPVNHFPVYEPSAERVTEIEKAFAEENNPLGVHFDGSKEIRAKGAGFYQFSADEETRKAQMEELKASREETERVRRGTGALSSKPGEVEGMHEVDAPGTTGTKSRAMEKRKRELEERRKLIEAKRRKIDGGVDMLAANMAGSSTEPTVPGPSTSAVSFPVPNDPFAALEAQSSTSKAKDSDKTSLPDAHAAPVLEADAFLSQLEEVFLGSMKKNR